MSRRPANDVLGLFDRPIAFHPALVKPCGSINATLMLSQAIYWTTRASLPNGWFYKTQSEWQDETGLTRREQDGARKLLIERGLLKEEKRGMPQKLYYQVQVEALNAIVDGKSDAPNRQTECTETPDSERTETPICMHQTANQCAPNRQPNTETTAESTKPLALTASAVPAEVCMTIPLCDGSRFPVEARQILEWKALYPGIDVEQELRSYLGWAIANPRKRKTRRGILASLNTWLCRSQDKAGGRGYSPQAPVHRTAGNADVLRRAMARIAHDASPASEGFFVGDAGSGELKLREVSPR